MKLTHRLDYVGPAKQREHGKKGVLYIHTWYSDEPGPHHGERLGWQQLVFNDSDSADKWIGNTIAAQVQS